MAKNKFAFDAEKKLRILNHVLGFDEYFVSNMK